MSMMELGKNADLESALRVFASTGHNGFIGLIPVGHGLGWIEFRLPWREDLTLSRASGIIHPSVIYSLLDSTCAMTTWAKQGFFAPYPTLDFRVDYLRSPTAGGDLFAHGECYELTANYAFMRGYAHEGDPARPVAHCSGTFMSFKERTS